MMEFLVKDPNNGKRKEAMINVELLQTTMKFIEENEELHSQSLWAASMTKPQEFEYERCGTAMCFAGWAVVLSSTESAERLFKWYQRASGWWYAEQVASGETIGVEAAELLGLNYAQANELFESTNSAEMLRVLVDDLCSLTDED